MEKAAGRQGSVRKQSTGLGANFRKYWPYYLMAFPGVVYLIIFKFVPMLGCVIAFQDYQVYKGIFHSDWVGMKNFANMFAYSDFSRILTNTLMMNELGSAKLKKTIQTAVYIPYFLSWIIVSELIFDFLGVSGLFNRGRALFGMRPLLVMQQSRYFRTVYVLSTIWKEAGWGTVVYMAAIAGIDQSLYEAASIDGATRLQKMRFITFPLILPTALTLLLLQIGSFMELGFEHVYSLLTPMTYSTGDIFDTYVYRVGILQAQYSITTAVGLFQSVIGLVMVVFFNQLSKKVSEDGGLW